MRTLSNKRIKIIVAMMLVVMMVVSAQPVSAATKTKTPSKVTGLKVAEVPMADIWIRSICGDNLTLAIQWISSEEMLRI